MAASDPSSVHDPTVNPSGAAAGPNLPAAPAKGRGLRRITALMLIVEALLIISPLTAINEFSASGQTIGKTLAFIPGLELLLLSIFVLASRLIWIGLFLAAWGIWHNSRGIAALVLQLAVVPFPLVGLLRPLSPIYAITGSRLIILAVVLMVSVMLVLVIRVGQPKPANRGSVKWVALSTFGVLVVVTAVIGATNRSLPGNLTPTLISSGSGSAPSESTAVRVPLIPQNPSLAKNPWNSIHNDSWGTDSYNIAAPADAPTATVDSLFTGGDCATMTWDSKGRIVTLCVTLARVIAYVLAPDTLDVIEQQQIATRKVNLTNFSGGGYFFLDAKDQIVVPSTDGKINVYSTADGIRLVKSIDIASTLAADEDVTSTMADWSGRYWYVGAKGTVGVVDPAQDTPRAVNLNGESIENSFVLTQDSAYVVTGIALYRLAAEPNSAPTTVWRTLYDSGSRKKPGQTSRASGTTPTVFHQGEYVAIADNAEPQMNVVVADTATGSITCQVPVFQPEASATENALIALGDTIIAENNFGYSPPIAETGGGNSTTPGMAAIQLDPATGSCGKKWENTTIQVPSVVSKATLAGDQVITYSKPSDPLGRDGWYFTGVSARTGEVLWTRLAGLGLAYNNHYAATYLSPDGDILTGTTSGIVRLKNGG
ncbi:MAG: hypothetical protein ACOYD0_12795 [Candidatus Nanopelagicales bacterium]